MIVPSMTPKDLSREILTDMIIVNRKALYLGKQIDRKARRTKRQNFMKVVEYHSKQKNKWLIIYVCEKYDLQYSIAVCFVNSTGLNVISVENNGMTLNHYYSHFFQRYNERLVKQKDIQKMELVKRFLSENHHAALRSLNDPEKKHDLVLFRFREGAAFGCRDMIQGKEYRTIKTFISEEMLNIQQQKEFGYATELYKSAWGEDYLPHKIAGQELPVL